LEQSQIRQQQLSVAIVGAKQSGKTTYLQALLNYFDQQFSTKYATQLDAPEGNKVSEARLAELKEFIRSGTLPQATKSATNVEKGSDRDPRKPIQFEFGGNVSPIKGIEIYDLAGEDMDSRESMALYKDVLVKCDLIILLVDPMQDPAMEQTTRGAVAAPPRGTAPFDVLRNLEETLLGSGVQRASQKLAVVVSKFDGVEVAAGMEGTPVFGILEKGLSLTRDVNTNSMKLYNERDGISLDREVMALIGKLDAMAAFTRALADSTVFSQKRCFVVSSLGHSTHAPRMDKAGITSFRISDPILWALEG
jgi:GTPase SAR1 family protein